MWICRWGSFFLVSVSLIVIAACADKRIPIIERECGYCHVADIVYTKKRTRAEWDRVVYGMMERGLKLTPDEEQQVKKALYENLALD